MHELSVTESLLEIALRHAKKGNARQITDLYLVLGEWSSLMDESVQFYWDIISEGSIAQGATLHFRRVPVLLICQDCGKEYHPAGESFTCPNCKGTNIKVKTGEEFHLEAIDVDE